MPNALIVDDSKTARYALRQLLDKQEIVSDMVESAEQALDYLREHSPDLIFMDHMMPGMDGFEAVKLIKANPATSHIPIVMYTSTQGGVYFGQARALGAADVIAKPATAQELQDVLQRITQRRQRMLATETVAEPATTTVAVEELPTPDEPVAEWAPPSSAPVPEPAQASVPGQMARSARLPWIIAMFATMAALALAFLYADSEGDAKVLRARHAAALEALQWALGPAEYAYGEAPFSGERLVRLQELLVHLQAIGFRGRVVMESHVGEYCLMEADGSTDGAEWVPAVGELAITECGTLGQSRVQSERMAREQSAAFQRFVERSPLLADGSLTVELIPRGADEPLVPYPSSAAVSAGVWNDFAQRNNRVTFELVERVR